MGFSALPEFCSIMKKYIVVYDDTGWDFDKNSRSPNKVVSELFDSWKAAYAVSSDMEKTNKDLDFSFYGNVQVVEIEI